MSPEAIVFEVRDDFQIQFQSGYMIFVIVNLGRVFEYTGHLKSPYWCSVFRAATCKLQLYRR